jgi:hypothetical protein
MTFDKSKVCVAGLHDVPVGARGYCANTVYNLERSVTTEEKQAVGVLYEACDGYYFVEGRDYNFDCTMFYPLPEKQYRPYATIEEAMVLKGKWIKYKAWDEYLMVTRISFLNGSLLLNDLIEDVIYDKFVMEDGTPLGVEV